MDDDSDPPGRDPTIGQAMVPVSLLIVMLASSVYLFGDESSSGPNQIALILATGTAVLVALLNGHRWKDLERGISRGLSVSMGAILILLVVGSVIGTWILAGVVPAMIYYGLSVLSPSIFYAAACAVCAVVALATGSSWTTAGTIGIALIGIATAQNLHLGLAAGAIISGAYFGDKMSPLSDTTNLAPAVAGTDLFAHIRHMVWTTTPSIAIMDVVPFSLQHEKHRGIHMAVDLAVTAGREHVDVRLDRLGDAASLRVDYLLAKVLRSPLPF